MPAPMPRRASAYDVYAVPGIGAVTATPSMGRRASFRALPPQEPSSPPSPEAVTTILVAPEEDRRNRRRGSQL